LTSPPEPLTSTRRRRHHGIFHHIPDSTFDPNNPVESFAMKDELSKTFGHSMLLLEMHFGIVNAF